MPRRKRRLASRVRHYARNFLAFLFSNIGVIVLVVAYTIAGAFMFQSIEGANEMERVNLMARDRDNTVLYLWHNVTLKYNPLNETAIKDRISIELVRYQRKIVFAVRRGWDGGRSSRQWSFSSSFLYSLTVITTIGYGHLSPRTSLGKMMTIFYALLGMPLFLLYLTNVGELLARWFKCLYALVCLCRGCPGFTRRRVSRLRGQLEVSDPESIERPEAWRHRNSSDGSFSPELQRRIPPTLHKIYPNHYRRDPTFLGDQGSRNFRNQDPRNFERYSSEILRKRTPCFQELYPDLYREVPRNLKIYSSDFHSRRIPEYMNGNKNYRYEDPRYLRKEEDFRRISNLESNEKFGIYNRQFQRRPGYLRSASMPQPYEARVQDPRLRGWSEPMGYHTQESSEFSYVTFDAQTITVPLSVCVAIMVGYIMFGSMLFGLWEKWNQVDGAYFCFISLSSIGFGDFVPGERVYTPRIETSFIACSLYLMLGMALVAMCFNLMQEQVIHYVAGLKRAVKRICRCKR